MDMWNDGAAYDRYMGRWSRLVAREFLAWLDVPRGSAWVDVCCGTGALSGVILETAEPRMVAGVDRSAAFVAAAREALGDRAQFSVADAMELPFGPAAFDAAVSGLALNFVADPLAAVAEFGRVTAPGGIVAVYVWDYAEGMQLTRAIWDAAIPLDPSAAELAEARVVPLCDPERLRQLFTDAGLDDVRTTAIEIPMVFQGFDDFWAPLLGGQGTAPYYVASLSTEAREQLRQSLLRSLPEVDGRIRLTARAFAVKGIPGDSAGSTHR